MENDRVIVHMVAHEGGVMLDVQAANDDHPRVGGWLIEVDHEGQLGIVFRSGEGGDVPMSMTLGKSGAVRIHESEDLFADSGPTLFDSLGVK